MKKNILRAVALLCVFCMLCTSMIGCDQKTSNNLIKRLSIGWSLGNTLDNIDYNRNGSWEFYEKLWGNPVTTKQMIDTVKEAGFGAVRIPVTWYDHADENGVIDSEWMNRVEEVVNYVLDNDMLCIINLHHDTGEVAWITADTDCKDESERILKSLWTQIAEHFKDYDERLMFEGFNEILNKEKQWSNVNAEDYAVVNELNQDFVDVIRQSGGQNAKRYLIVNTYGALTDQKTLDAFVMPKDSTDDRLIAEVHFYDTSETAIDSMINRLKSKFVNQKIPVIIGEFGMAANSGGGVTEKRRNYAKYFVTKAKEAGIGCFWWDNGGMFARAEDVTNFALLNRTTCEWYDKELVETIINSAKDED